MGDEERKIKKKGSTPNITQPYILSHGLLGNKLNQCCILKSPPLIVTLYQKEAIAESRILSATPHYFGFYFVSKLVFFGFKSIFDCAFVNKCFTSANVTKFFCSGAYNLYFNDSKLVFNVIVVAI